MTPPPIPRAIEGGLERRKMNGIILAGGHSSRFGENKAFIDINSRFLIERIVDLLRQIFRKVYIVTNSPREYKYLGTETVVDIFRERGPLGGIHAGLLASDSCHNFIAACDMPFLDIGLIRDLADKIEDFDLVVPKFGERLQMLHAFYSKNCISIIEEQLMASNLKLRNLLPKVNSKIIEYQNFGQSFMNINTHADYEEAVSLVN
ncbi:MAG: molybdenum cofactor guanylyltransferase [Candidatus Margulisiibacteriota bacterium]